MKGLVTTAVVLVTVCTVLDGVQSTRIRLSLSLLQKVNASRKVSSSLSAEPPCKDSKLNPAGIKEITTDKVESKELQDLDKLREETKFFSSADVKEKMDALFKTKVEGTDHTAKEFLEAMSKGGCPVYIYGGAARDILRGMADSVKDIDAETSCKLGTVKKLCEDKFNTKDKKLCFAKGRYPFSLINFGDEKFPATMIDLASNQHTFFEKKKTYLEYSPNALAYDFGGQNLIVDLTGNSVEDVCALHVRIPVGADDRDTWAEQTDKDGKKIFRYWKLRGKGFSPIDKEGTKAYVIKKASEFIAKDKWQKMKIYYCVSNYGTNELIENDEGCNAAKDLCKDAKVQAKAKAFREATAADLKGWMPPRCGKKEWNFGN